MFRSILALIAAFSLMAAHQSLAEPLKPHRASPTQSAPPTSGGATTGSSAYGAAKGAVAPKATTFKSADGAVAVFATTSLQCGNDVYTVSTGTNTGNCGSGNGGANCYDNGKPAASASCATGCGNTNGAGTCTKKSLK